MEQNKKTITNLELEKLRNISNHLFEYFEMLNGFTSTDLGFEIALKLKSIIDKIEESNK